MLNVIELMIIIFFVFINKFYLLNIDNVFFFFDESFLIILLKLIIYYEICY